MSEEAAYASALFEARDKELADLRRRIASGEVQVKDLASQDTHVFRHRTIARSRLLEVLNRVRNFGIGQVSDELVRQGS